MTRKTNAIMRSKIGSLFILSVCEVAVMALWFSASAVIPSLKAEYGLSSTQASLFANPELVSGLCAGAEKKRIPYQRCILPRGGQDGAAIQRSGPGARPAAIVCGTRYIHTVTESIDKNDLQATINLLAAWLPTVK